MFELIKKTAKLIVRLILGLLSMFGILLCLFLVFWLLIIPIGNEVILKGYVEELQSYDTGSDYEVVETAGACGKLFGNGNGMQYLAVALIKSETELAESELSMGDGIFVIRADNEERLRYILDPYNSGRLEVIKKKLEELSASGDLAGYYILESMQNAPMDSIWTWDLRAH